MKRRNLVAKAGALSVLAAIVALSAQAADPARPSTAPRPLAPARPSTKLPPVGVKGDDDPRLADSNDTDSKPADDSTGIDTKKLEAAYDRLELQAAESYLKLADLDLQKINQLNDKIAGLYSGSDVDILKASVEIAKERVREARQKLDGKKDTAIVGVAQVRLKTVQQIYERNVNANRRRDGTVGPLDMERSRIAVESARIDLERAKIVSQLDSPLALVRWDMEQLREEVRQLRFRITSITARR